MKTKIIIATLILSLVSILSLTYNIQSQETTSFDYPHYDTELNAINASDLIVEGKILRTYEETINISNTDEPVMFLYTVSEVEVMNVAKGNIKKGDIIKIKQLGDQEDNRYEEIYNYGYFKKDQVKLFFLVGFNDTPYSTINPYQGHLDIKNGKIVINNNDSKLFVKFNKKNKDDIIQHIKDKSK